MSKYLLLRNNKENGPFELHELVSFGLKPYDLIWVEGKSAAWRYPSELEELKPYAPLVEEQPFDRFFKKESSVKEQNKPALTVAAVSTGQKTETEEKYQQYFPKKSVVVTLPAKRKVAVLKPVPASPVVTEKPIKETPTITITENPAAQVKYAQPLDEIKEMYVKTLEQRRAKNARKALLIKNLKRGAIVAGLVASGLLVGLLIKPGENKNQQVAQQPVQISPETVMQNPEQPIEEQQKDHSSSDTPVQIEQAVPEQDAREKKMNAPVNEETVIPRQKSEPQIKKEAIAAKETAALVSQKKNEPISEARPLEKDPATGERNRVTREDENSASIPAITTTPSPKINTWGNLVSVNSNDYKRVALGGIRNLELTVTNDSKKTIEKVIVELQYLKSSDSPFRTEMVEFRSIAPNGGTRTLRMPDTNRGAKVSYRIIDVQTADNATASAGF